MKNHETDQHFLTRDRLFREIRYCCVRFFRNAKTGEIEPQT